MSRDRADRFSAGAGRSLDEPMVRGLWCCEFYRILVIPGHVVGWRRVGTAL